MSRGEANFRSVKAWQRWSSACVRRYTSQLETVPSCTGWGKIFSPIRPGLVAKNDEWSASRKASLRTYRLCASLCFRRFPPTSVAWRHCINTCAGKPSAGRHAVGRDPQRNPNSLFIPCRLSAGLPRFRLELDRATKTYLPLIDAQGETTVRVVTNPQFERNIVALRSIVRQR